MVQRREFQTVRVFVQAMQLRELDARGYLEANPRSGSWKQALDQDLKHVLSDKLVSAIPQALNVAYAQHEMLADQMPAILRFLQDKTL